MPRQFIGSDKNSLSYELIQPRGITIYVCHILRPKFNLGLQGLCQQMFDNTQWL